MKDILALRGYSSLGGILILFLLPFYVVDPEPEITGKALPEPAAIVLKEVMAASGVSSVRVTSTSRTPRMQARAMHGFVQRHGLKAARRLYGPEGDAVLAVYQQHRREDRKTCVKAMHEEVARQLPRAHANNRLMHTKPTHYVFDVAIRSIAPARRADFNEAARRHPRISRFLGPADGEKREPTILKWLNAETDARCEAEYRNGRLACL